MTYPVETIASYILSKTGTISAMKLQKLAYYCQAWALAWNEEPLIQEEFEAWAFGPVCPELYKLHKGKHNVSESDIKSAVSEVKEIDEVSADTMDSVISAYGELEGHILSQITHIEGPWTDARGDLPAMAKSKNIIPKKELMKYYKNEIKHSENERGKAKAA